MKKLLFSAAIASALLSSSAWTAETLKTKINGMTCGGCTAKITAELKKLPEVADAKVDLKTRTATITLKDGMKLGADRVQQTIEAAGYTVAQ
jgi:copper chaperone CopZ